MGLVGRVHGAGHSGCHELHVVHADHPRFGPEVEIGAACPGLPLSVTEVVCAVSPLEVVVEDGCKGVEGQQICHAGAVVLRLTERGCRVR